MSPSERKRVWERLGCSKGDVIKIGWSHIEAMPEEIQDAFLTAAQAIMKTMRVAPLSIQDAMQGGQ
jgi:hypothetical protein